MFPFVPENISIEGSNETICIQLFGAMLSSFSELYEEISTIAPGIKLGCHFCLSTGKETFFIKIERKNFYCSYTVLINYFHLRFTLQSVPTPQMPPHSPVPEVLFGILHCDYNTSQDIQNLRHPV